MSLLFTAIFIEVKCDHKKNWDIFTVKVIFVNIKKIDLSF